MSVCRAHVTRTTPKEDRTFHFAYLSALQFVGFAVLPGLGGVLAALPTVNVFGFMELNAFTYPGLVLLLTNVLVIFLLYWYYLDPPEEVSRHKPTQSSAQSQTPMPDDSPDWLALMCCLLINVCFRGVVAELETLASPVLMETFDEDVETSSYVIGSLGFIGLFVYFGFKPIARTFSDRQLVFVGLVLISLGNLLLYQRLFPLPLWLYATGLGLIWSLAYPLGQTAVLSLFSKILAGLPAGGFLGIFSACGSLARVIFATFSGLVWSYFGSTAVFGLTSLYGVLMMLLTLVIYSRLVPARQTLP
uniref:Major facilitator superfamily (MFS) profile domain-containing protein n=1 Tax=Timspurckia oligopyrenoides TaxID=708627 RepID=A0A7S0ZJH0_9RHOD